MRPARGSVFLVEDEVMIRMMVADMLEELGFSVAAEAREIDDAIRLAETASFDLAILDVNVNGKIISPVAEVIEMRKRPFIFATGYGLSGLPEQFRNRPALQKPFQLDTLGRTIAIFLGQAREAVTCREDERPIACFQKVRDRRDHLPIDIDVKDREIEKGSFGQTHGFADLTGLGRNREAKFFQHVGNHHPDHDLVFDQENGAARRACRNHVISPCPFRARSKA